MICLSTAWFAVALVPDAMVAGSITFVAAALLCAGGRDD
jgi:hypothetical protein